MQHTAGVMRFAAPRAGRWHSHVMRKDPDDFMGPRRPMRRERRAWAGITAPGDQPREHRLFWRRRQKQMLAAKRGRE
jgi:hypothetical protein